MADVLAVRGFLLHVSHYDPVWWRRKAREKPMDLKLAGEIIDAMAEAGMNLLVIDVADGVRFKSHPELRRPYSITMGQQKRLADRARKRGLEVVPKLNFAQSHLHGHNHWFRPYHRLFDSDEYWDRGFELIDELVETCKPERFFHVGMDEDHDRSCAQYLQAILTLHAGLKERGLRTVIWKDEQTYAAADVHREKSRAAENKLPRDIVQVPWHYNTVLTAVLRRLARKGFEVWGAPGRDPDQVRAWRDGVLRCGGTGMLLTNWAPCRPGNRRKLLSVIRNNGPLLSGG